ncbi:MAG: tRNA (N(6)-L-threonylcarbamoyladenosine(37)-C(2))-methylthiotransferase MtaB [bacterium]
MNSKAEKTIRFQTVGCRLNQYESEKMAAELYPYGFRRAVKDEKADLTVINTCTVTHRADSDCRYMIRRAYRHNPNGRIVVVGCFVDHEPEMLAAMEGVDVLIHNNEKNNIAAILPKKMPELFDIEPDLNCSTAVADFNHRNRAWLKVSDGCNQQCSFCIITIVRGKLINRPADQIIDEVKSLVSFGYNEVVLTGVNLGYYKDKTQGVKNLAGLCKLIMEKTDLYRVRLSSVEPQIVDNDLIQLFAGSDGRICRHFHLPLQSGSDKILRMMRRPYKSETFFKKAEAVKEVDPHTVVGADVIVGFPGETEDDFTQTCQVCESGLVDYLHVFSYSDRTGTKASQMEGKVDSVEIKNRSQILNDLSDRLIRSSLKKQIGETLEVISEQKSDKAGSHFAVSDNYLKVKLPVSLETGKAIVKVKIEKADDDYLTGEIIS